MGPVAALPALLRLPEPLLPPLFSVFKNVQMVTICSAFNCQVTSGSSHGNGPAGVRGSHSGLGGDGGPEEVARAGGAEELLVGAFGFQALLQESTEQRGSGLPRAAQPDGPAPTLLSVPGLLPQLVTDSALRSLSTLCFPVFKGRADGVAPHQATSLAGPPHAWVAAALLRLGGETQTLG